MELRIDSDFKTCSKCDKEFPATTDYFYKQKVKNKNETYYILTHWCKACKKESAENWRKDPDSREAFLAAKRKRNKHPDHKKELERANNRRRKGGYFKKYQQENKDKIQQYNLNRRQHKEHEISDQEWFECLDYFNNSCAYCGKSEGDTVKQYGQLLHKEHVEQDGANDITNCVPACKSCNSLKWEYELNDWYNENNPVYSKRRYNKIIKWLLSFATIK